jgi:hypothetical protein
MIMVKKYRIFLWCFFILFLKGVTLKAQSGEQADPLFRDVVMKIDTTYYSLKQNKFMHQGEPHLYFYYREDMEVAEVRFYPKDMSRLKDVRLFPSSEYVVMDSLLNVNDEYLRLKVRFNNLTTGNFFSFTFVIEDALVGKPLIKEIRLFPLTKTFVMFYPTNDELFIGEEKVFDLVTNNIKNIRYDNSWQTYLDFDYKIVEKNGQLKLHVIPKALGRKSLQVNFETRKPYLNEQNKLVYKGGFINAEFTVKGSRLGFLGIDKKEVTLDQGSNEAIEIQLDRHPNLALNKTYRIENQEKTGGALIAELFTRSQLTNDKILCWLRVYSFHKKTDGYLYIKDGDLPKFITNLSISPNTSISRISVLREGAEWTDKLSVRPGEKVEIRLEGLGMHKAKFHFEGLDEVTQDSLIMNENMAVYKGRVPLNINKSKIAIFNHGKNTGYTLNVLEYKEPRPLDFVQVNYGAGRKQITEINKPILYDRPVSELVIAFSPEVIDRGKKLYGKQHLDIEIRITGPRNEILDIKTIENVVVCPAENSPRFMYYEDRQCFKGYINLNTYLTRKTYDLEDWSRIQVTVKHRRDKYDEEGFSKTIEVILQRHTSFDIDVSFPAGLITKKVGEEGFGNLGGISLAMIAQFSFYKPNKVAQFQPYRIGAGFIALNTFNFAEDGRDRDLGIVILGSLYPSRKDVKLSFPLFGGGGYLLQERRWFFLFGPGIRIRL